jgi:hypothetical protein
MFVDYLPISGSKVARNYLIEAIKVLKSAQMCLKKLVSHAGFRRSLSNTVNYLNIFILPLRYMLKVYTFVQTDSMKTLSLKLDEKIFDETEEIVSKMNLARNRYINEAINIYNTYNRRRLLKKQLVKESKLTMPDSMTVLVEFEKIINED